jgi:hypothetical protein
MVDIERVLRNRAASKTRVGKPLIRFIAAFLDINAACEVIMSDKLPRFRILLERAAVISIVTSIEVYYRDMLDGIFRVCKAEYFKPFLKELSKGEKYDIDDLIVMHERNIHPLELIVSRQSFQSIGAIEAVYSRLIGKEFWKSVCELKIRLEEEPKKIHNFDRKQLAGLGRVFQTRHELVHNPSTSDSQLTNALITDIASAAWMVFGSDFVIAEAIEKNLDEKVRAASATKPLSGV